MTTTINTDGFEQAVQRLLEAEGFWVRRAVKVNLSQDEKRQIGKTSAPRPIVDMVALHLARGELLALEAKSYADTPGVKLAQMQEEHEVPAGRFKLFTSERYRTIVLARLKQDLLEAGMALPEMQVRLGLIAGKVNQGQSQAIRELMEARGWLFWSPDDIKAKQQAGQNEKA